MQEDDKGPSAAVAIELRNLSEIIHVHITHVNIPITLLSIMILTIMTIMLCQEIGFMIFIKSLR